MPDSQRVLLETRPFGENREQRVMIRIARRATMVVHGACLDGLNNLLDKSPRPSMVKA